jgi:hypothetical protein
MKSLFFSVLGYVIHSSGLSRRRSDAKGETPRDHINFQILMQEKLPIISFMARSRGKGDR